MFSKKNRINTERFQEVFLNGQVKRTEVGLVKISPNNLSFPRFAVVVSKKIVNSAVKRNLLRRRIYNFLKNNPEKYKKDDYVLLVSKDFAVADKKKQKELLNKLSLV